MLVAILAAIVSAIGYLVLGITASIWIGFFAALISFVVLVGIAQVISKRGKVPADIRAQREA